MLTEPLPSQVDIRKLAHKGAEINAKFSVSQLPRFAAQLANAEGFIEAHLQFYVDEQKTQRVDGTVKSSAFVVCQRCLEPMPISLESQFELAVVRDDEQAKQLPGRLDPLVVADELVNLDDVVEEELILSLPFVSYHSPGDCQQQTGFSTGEFAEPEEAPEQNPFNVLEQLKSDKV